MSTPTRPDGSQIPINPDRAALLQEGLKLQHELGFGTSNVPLPSKPFRGQTSATKTNLVPLGQRGGGRWNAAAIPWPSTASSTSPMNQKKASHIPPRAPAAMCKQSNANPHLKAPPKAPAAMRPPRNLKATPPNAPATMCKPTGGLASINPKRPKPVTNHPLQCFPQHLRKRKLKKLLGEASQVPYKPPLAAPRPPKKVHPHPEPHPGGGLEIVTRATIKILPPDYSHLPVGNIVITKKCKSLCISQNKHFYSVYPGGASNRSGYLFPSGILQQAREYESSTRDARDAAMKNRDTKERDTAMSELLRQLPKIAKADADNIIERAWEKYSHRVGRTGTISLEDKVKLAALAHIRHQHTVYTQELRRAREKIALGNWRMGARSKTETQIKLEARRAVQDQIQKVWERWGGKSLKDCKIKTNMPAPPRVPIPLPPPRGEALESNCVEVGTNRNAAEDAIKAVSEKSKRRKGVNSCLGSGTRTSSIDPHGESYEHSNDQDKVEIVQHPNARRPVRTAALVARERNKYDLERLEGLVTKLGGSCSDDDFMDQDEDVGMTQGQQSNASIEVIDLVTDTDGEEELDCLEWREKNDGIGETALSKFQDDGVQSYGELVTSRGNSLKRKAIDVVNLDEPGISKIRKKRRADEISGIEQEREQLRVSIKAERVEDLLISPKLVYSKRESDCVGTKWEAPHALSRNAVPQAVTRSIVDSGEVECQGPIYDLDTGLSTQDRETLLNALLLAPPPEIAIRETGIQEFSMGDEDEVFEVMELKGVQFA